MNERIEKSIKFGEFMDPNHYAWNTYSKTRKNSPIGMSLERKYFYLGFSDGFRINDPILDVEMENDIAEAGDWINDDFEKYEDEYNDGYDVADEAIGDAFIAGLKARHKLKESLLVDKAKRILVENGYILD